MELIEKENKRKGTKRRSKNCETLKQEEINKQIDDDITLPPRRRSARLVAISKPNSNGMNYEAAQPKLTRQAKEDKEEPSLATTLLFLVAAPQHPSNGPFSASRPLEKKRKATKSFGEGTSQATLASSDDDGEDEWGAFELLHPSKADKKVIEVELDEKSSDLFKRRMNPLAERDAKEGEERAKWEHEMELEIMRKRRELQENTHRFHFLTYIGHLYFMANALLQNGPSFIERFAAMFEQTSAPLTPIQMRQFLTEEFRGKFRCQNDILKEPIKWCTTQDNFVRHLLTLIGHGTFSTAREIALIFFALCSFVLRLRARVCVAFNPMPRLMIEPKQGTKKTGKRKKNDQKAESARDGSSSDEQIAKGRSRRKGNGRTEVKAAESPEGAASLEAAYWNEYWDDVERRWICVDTFHCLVDEPQQIEHKFGVYVGKVRKILYVLSIDTEKGMREIGAKYVGDYLSAAVRKLRTDGEWIGQTMELPALHANENCSRLEDAQIYELLKSKPMPTVLSEFKNHPLYALKKDLLKFDAIYPSDIQPIGYIGKQRHEVFPRSAIHKLEGSLNWIKESRSIKAGEKPYKVVSARPKLNVPKEKREPLTLDLFGYWQTEPYVPPEVTADGRIPRNEFGNLYMYKEEMLPKGCVHLRLSGIYLVARRMDLEAVPAVVGWEFSGGFNHPILDGCVVLRKDEEVLRSAWQEMVREKAAKMAKRTAERVWKNWRRLIKGKMLLQQMRKSARLAVRAQFKSGTKESSSSPKLVRITTTEDDNNTQN
uniref:Uncharacterized protein n=1 Tax=Globodera rostochiensis TaxID=31243 RepID=A0A914HIM9_GLORO